MPLDNSHNTIFFSYPLNYNIDQESEAAINVSDNDFNTYSTEDSITLKIGSSNTKYDYIFIKAKNLATIAGGDIDIDYSTSLPTHIIRWEKDIAGLYGEINENDQDIIDLTQTERDALKDNYRSITYKGFENYLINIDSDIPPSDTEITLEFTGTGKEIYEVMVLNSVLEIGANSKFIKVEHNLIDRGGLIQEDIGGGISKAPAINNTRWKYDINYGAIFANGDANDTLIEFITENSNFGFCEEYSRFPWIVFPAVFPDLNTQIKFLTRQKNDNRVFFRLSES